MVAKRIAEQPTWVDHDKNLKDLRQLSEEFRLVCPGVIDAAENVEDALKIVLDEFGLPGVESSVVLKTFVGDIHVNGENLAHTVEKRADARERYIKYVLKTLQSPFEVWKSLYDNGDYRLLFIGTFQTKNQMLVVVSVFENKTLWNFMHCDAKSLNKHRAGELIYQKDK